MLKVVKSWVSDSQTVMIETITKKIEKLIQAEKFLRQLEECFGSMPQVVRFRYSTVAPWMLEDDKDLEDFQKIDENFFDDTNSILKTRFYYSVLQDCLIKNKRGMTKRI